MSLHTEGSPSAVALEIFERLGASVTPAQMLSMRDDIDRHLLEIQKLARRQEMTPLDMAEGIASGLHQLLDDLSNFESVHQTAVLGAALYFVSTHDEIPDTDTILGLDDDAAVFNHVAKLVGRADLLVEL